MSLHVCLISDQLLANYLPVKQLRPQKVVMVNTSYTRNKGLDKRFAQMVEKLGVECIDYPEDVPDDNYINMENAFRTLNGFLMALGETEIKVNLVGGNKLLALAAHSQLKNHGVEFIYLHTDKSVIEFISETSSVLQPLDDLLTIDDYMAAYNVQLNNHNSASEQWQATLEKRWYITKKLAGFAHESTKASFLGRLNHLCKNALAAPSKAHQMRWISNRERSFFKDCEQYGLLSFNAKTDEILFANTHDITYFYGIWLEEFVYGIAKQAGFHSVRCGQRIQLGEDKVENELDLVIVHNNKMLVMECKSANFLDKYVQEKDMLYKLDSVSDELKGLYGSTWLVSARPVTMPAVLDRAKRLKIEILHSTDIVNLRQKLQQWASKKKK